MTRVATLLGCALVAVGWHAGGASADETSFDRAAEAAGLRRIAAKHLTLATDLRSSAAVDSLGEAFDLAFPEWCRYFGLDSKQYGDWHVRGCLMQARQRFVAAGLLPAELPPFVNGFATSDRLWLDEKSSDYYRRHLLLHEGTHALMHALLGGVGPQWYCEGMAELLATHRLEGGKLSLGYFPRSREEVPKWGRIEIVQTAYAARKALGLAKIFAYSNHPQSDNDLYGWCWAAAAFFDNHPRYQARFRQLPKFVGQADFNEQLATLFAPDWQRVNEDWQLFVANIDYGYDFARMDFEPANGAPLVSQGAQVTVAADRGWQSSGVAVEKGRKYRIRASGRYLVAQGPPEWPCEPGGVTIRYYHGQPLGILLAAVRADQADAGAASGLLKPLVVGLETTFDCKQSGTLYLRVNDSAGSLADNSGSLRAEILPE